MIQTLQPPLNFPFITRWFLLPKGQLGRNTAAHFDASKRFRSSEFSSPALPVLHRMAKRLLAYMSPQAVRTIAPRWGRPSHLRFAVWSFLLMWRFGTAPFRNLFGYEP